METICRQGTLANASVIACQIGIRFGVAIRQSATRVGAFAECRHRCSPILPVDDGEPEAMNKMADTLGEPEELMRARLELIQSALARLIVVDDPVLNAAAIPKA